MICLQLYTSFAIYLFAFIELFLDDNFNILGGVDGKDSLLTNFDALEKRISNVEDAFAYPKFKTKDNCGTSKHGGCKNTNNKL